MKTVSVVPESDDCLVKKALEGDKPAFGQLVSRYERKVFSLVMELVRHRQDAEDITQEVFVRVFFSLKNFRSESSFYTWLYRIAYNMTIDFKRRVARRPQDAVAIGKKDSNGRDIEISNTELVSSVQQPDEVIDNQERQLSIRAALSEISEEHRAVILLREVDGLSYDEISRVTGSARGTVMSRLHYARKHLQKVLRGLRSGGDSNAPDEGSTLTLPDDSEKDLDNRDRRVPAQQLAEPAKRWRLQTLLADKLAKVEVELNSVNLNLGSKRAKL